MDLERNPLLNQVVKAGLVAIGRFVLAECEKLHAKILQNYLRRHFKGIA